MSAAHLTWDRGGEASFIEVSDDRVRLRSTRACAPGSRVEGALKSAARVRIKVHGSKKVAPDEDIFEVHGRLIDATRGLRDELLALLEAREA